MRRTPGGTERVGARAAPGENLAPNTGVFGPSTRHDVSTGAMATAGASAGSRGATPGSRRNGTRLCGSSSDVGRGGSASVEMRAAEVRAVHISTTVSLVSSRNTPCGGRCRRGGAVEDSGGLSPEWPAAGSGHEGGASEFRLRARQESAPRWVTHRSDELRGRGVPGPRSVTRVTLRQWKKAEATAPRRCVRGLRRGECAVRDGMPIVRHPGRVPVGCTSWARAGEVAHVEPQLRLRQWGSSAATVPDRAPPTPRVGPGDPPLVRTTPGPWLVYLRTLSWV